MTTELIGYSLKRLFVGRNEKLMLLALTFSSSVIAISELGIAKIFTEVIFSLDGEGGFPTLLIALFVCLSVTARIGHYFQRTKRISILDIALKRSKIANLDNSWNLSLSVEIANIMGYLLQILIVVAFLMTLSWSFGLLVVSAVVVTLLIFSALFKKQESFQKNLFRAKYQKREVASSERILTRVRGGEIGALFSGFIAVASLVALMFFHQTNLISTSNTVLAFFAVRMLFSNLNSLSSALMRHARALVNSSISTVNVTKNSSPDESL